MGTWILQPNKIISLILSQGNQEDVEKGKYLPGKTLDQGLAELQNKAFSNVVCWVRTSQIQRSDTK